MSCLVVFFAKRVAACTMFGVNEYQLQNLVKHFHFDFVVVIRVELDEDVCLGVGACMHWELINISSRLWSSISLLPVELLGLFEIG